jgi:hypothetical protein
MYTLRFPFRLPDSQAISLEENTFEIGKRHYRLSKSGNWYIFKIEGFESESEARNAVPTLWSGLRWVLLNANLAPSAVIEVSTVTYADDPEAAAVNLSKSFGIQFEEPVDGLIDGSCPAVFQSEKKLRVSTVGDVTFTVITPASRIIQLLQEHSLFPAPELPLCDCKLGVALDLYSAYFSESSPNARFLTLVMALEALASGTQRPQPVLELLEHWKVQAQNAKTRCADDPECLSALESLSRELLFRKENSIRSQIRSLVLKALSGADHSDAQETANAAVKIYDYRSTLVHDGSLDRQVLSKATTDAKAIVERVLRSRFLKGPPDSEESNI